MSILRKISSFAATTLVAAAPLCIGVCSAPLALAAPSDTPVTSTSSPAPVAKPQNLNDWTKTNCPGGEQFVNQVTENTPIYLGYANGKTYLGYTDAKNTSLAGQGKRFVDPHSDAKYKEKIGTCVRVAADQSGQSSAQVFYGALFKADKSALAASGFSKDTQTVFQVTKVNPWDSGTKVESRARWTSATYQQMPFSVSAGQSDSGFKNLLSGDESSVELRFSQSGFYTIHLKAITTNPQNPDKSYQTEMAYTFIVGKEAAVPQDLQHAIDENTGEGPDNPPTPNPGETTPGTSTPGHGNEGGDSNPGTNPTPNPGVTPDPRTPHHGNENGNANSGTDPSSQPATGATGSTQRPGLSSSSRLQASSRLGGTNSARLGGSITRAQLPQPLAGAFPTLPDPATSSAEAGDQAGIDPDSAAANSPNSDSQANNQNPLKFQAANTSTKQAAQQWIRSSSLAVFVVGLAAAGLTGLGLLAFSRLHP